MIIPIRDVGTNFEGFAALTDIHATVTRISKDNIEFDFSNVGWFDANMAAPFGAISDTCIARGVKVSPTKLRPDIAKTFAKSGFTGPRVADTYGTVIPYQRFAVNDAILFAQYTDTHLRGKGMPKMSAALRQRFLLGLDEIFQNAVIHSKTKRGIFCCGQYYPRRRRLVFSIADLGIGIRENLAQKLQLKLAADEAIRWVMEEGRTTRTGDVTGGLGLKLLRDFCKLNGGKLIIVSDAGYWSFIKGKADSRVYRHQFPGTVVNLEINTADTSVYFLSGEVRPEEIF